MTLTIAIPTFNRKEVVGNLLLRLNSRLSEFDFKCLIIDDGSSDGTLEHLVNLKLNSDRFKIIGRENVGYARTFLEILTKTETEWVLVTADDDDIRLENLSMLYPQMSRPDLSVIVTNYESKDGKFWRGNRGVGLLSATDLNHTAHAPGIAYRPSALVNGMKALEDSLNRGSEAGFFYPQVVISAHAVASRSAIFLPVTVVKEIDELPSQLVHSSGRNYWDPYSRIHQYISFVPIFKELSESGHIDSEIVASELLESNRRNFLKISEEIFGLGGKKSSYRIEVIKFLVTSLVVDSLRIRRIKAFVKKSDFLVGLISRIKRT